MPVTPIKAIFDEGLPQKTDNNSPTNFPTGSGATKTGSPKPGGLALAAKGPIIAAAAPEAKACRQKKPPSTCSPGRPRNKLPGYIHLESQVIFSIKGLTNPTGVLRPASLIKS